MQKAFLALLTCALAGTALPTMADDFNFSTGAPDGKIATASRPEAPGKIEIESADDFILSLPTHIQSATFTGLIPLGVPLSNVNALDVEIYRVFPNDSNTVRTINVPTRVNSPSDVAFDSRDAASGGLTFSSGVLNSNFTAANSVVNGIHPKPGQLTHGEGAVTGQEVQFTVDFTTPFDLPADHYFFVPQVGLTGSDDFLWLSAPKPNGPPDLQSWIRNGDLDPDWLRIGTDITAQGPFNASFSLHGTAVPEPGSIALMVAGGIGAISLLRRRKR